MDLSDLTRVFLYCFYLIGYSAYNPRHLVKVEEKVIRRHPTAPNLKLNKVSITLGVIIVAVTVSGLIFQNFYDEDDNQVHIFFGNFFFGILFVTNISVVGQSILLQHSLRSVILKFTVIEQIFIWKLKGKPNYEGFGRRYAMKSLLCYALFAVATIQMIVMNMLDHRDMKVSFHLAALSFMSITANMHALFYIDLECFFCRFFVKSIEIAGKARLSYVLFGKGDGTAVVITQLGYYKHVHFKLWDVGVAIGGHFGWNLMLTCLESFFNSAYSIYWIYRSLHTGIHLDIIGN